MQLLTQYVMRALILWVFIGFGSPVLCQESAEKELTLRKSVYFGGGSYIISQDQILEIKEFIESVDNIKNYQITISGHTDNIGGKEFNEWLSHMRSEKVKENILELDVPEELIFIKKFGQDNPLYDNEKHEGRARNRRVDILLSPIVF
ncbi:MAG: OmpA family protein [Cyclobacteriaceae bacterium]|nr:OmpA family protein [Cyclobacteriaceae bacterium]